MKSCESFTKKSGFILLSFNALKIEKNSHLQGVIHPTYLKYLSMDGLHSPQIFLLIHYLQRESLQPAPIQYLLFKSVCLYLHQNR